MKIENIVLIVLIVVVGGVFAYSLMGISGNSVKKSTTQETNVAVEKAPSDSLASIDSGSTSSGDVLVELTPHKISNGELVVDMSMNTHSVTLSNFDLKEIVTLNIGGKLIKPTSAPTLAGHHNSGSIVFPVTSTENSFTITIEGIPNVQTRTFTW